MFFPNPVLITLCFSALPTTVFTGLRFRTTGINYRDKKYKRENPEPALFIQMLPNIPLSGVKIRVGEAGASILLSEGRWRVEGVERGTTG